MLQTLRSLLSGRPKSIDHLAKQVSDEVLVDYLSSDSHLKSISIPQSIQLKKMFDATASNPDDKRMMMREKVLNSYRTYIAKKRDSLLGENGKEDELDETERKTLKEIQDEYKRLVDAVRRRLLKMSDADLPEIENMMYEFLSRPDAKKQQRVYALFYRNPFIMDVYRLPSSNGRWLREDDLFPYVRLFLEYGTDPDVLHRYPEPTGLAYTPLMMAAISDHKRIATLLLDYGADPNKGSDDARIIKQYNPLTFAVDSYDMVSLLLERGANNLTGSVTAFMRSTVPPASYRAFRIVSLLLNYGADPNEIGYEGMNLLTYASMYGNKNIVDLLLKKHARSISINARVERSETALDFWSWTALMCASYEGNTEIVSLLLEHGADPSILDERTHNIGKSALMLANERGNKNIVDLLSRYMEIHS